MATKKTQKSERVIAVENLRDANKEVKSISGVCKIIQKFWGAGYNKAFKYFEYQKSNFTPEILDQIDKRMLVDGVVCKVVKKFVKDDKGSFVKDANGKRQYTYELKPVTVWSVTTLWTILDQSTRFDDFKL